MSAFHIYRIYRLLFEIVVTILKGEKGRSSLCKNAGVVKKSPHKIRKTYGSILIDSGVDESLIIEQMGHTDIKTTKEHYYRNRKNKEQKTDIINAVIGL